MPPTRISVAEMSYGPLQITCYVERHLGPLTNRDSVAAGHLGRKLDEIVYSDYNKPYNEDGSMYTKLRDRLYGLSRMLSTPRDEVTRKAYCHNRTNSEFCRLPVEIFLAIAENLAPVSRFALERV